MKLIAVLTAIALSVSGFVLIVILIGALTPTLFRLAEEHTMLFWITTSALMLLNTFLWVRALVRARAKGQSIFMLWNIRRTRAGRK